MLTVVILKGGQDNEPIFREERGRTGSYYNHINMLAYCYFKK